MSKLVDEYIYIYVLVSHPQKTSSEKFRKCDVNIGYVLKRMLLLNLVEKLVAGSCAEG